MSKVHPRNDRKYKQVKITKEQLELAISLWDKEPWKNVCLKVFNVEKMDGRDKRAVALKKALVKAGKVQNDSQLHSSPANQLVDELTSEQKKETIAFYNEGETYTKIARYVYKDDTIRATDRRALKVRDYLKSVFGADYNAQDDTTSETYHPPKAIGRLVNLVNSATSQSLKDSSLSPAEKINIEQLRRFLQYPLFLNKINSIKKTVKRTLFEQTFVQYVWDKPDLIPEDANQYVSLAHEHVHENSIIEQLEHLDGQLENSVSDREYGMKLIEAINSTTVKLKECKERQRRLYDNLISKRSKRQEDSNRENSALSLWFKEWKNKEWRDKLIYATKRREKLEKEEVGRLDSFSSLLANVNGLGRDEI